MRRALSVFLILCMTVTLTTGLGVNASAEEPVIHEKEMNFYIGDPEVEASIPIYFIGDSDVPYISLEDWGDLLVELSSNVADDDDEGEPAEQTPAAETGKDDKDDKEDGKKQYSLAYAIDGNTGTLTREDGFWASFDCDKDVITFLDYNAFVRRGGDRLLIDILSVDDPQSVDDVQLYKRGKGSYERYGDMLTLDLKSYGIDLVCDGKNCYVPIQTLSDFMLAVNYLNIYYNSEAFFVVPYQGLGNESAGFTPIGELYYSVQPKQWSQTMADYNYAELCLAMDHLYGLKDIHHIDSFDALLYQIGLKDDMKSTDPALQDEALYQLINYHLDDLHSGFNNAQPLFGDKGTTKLSDKLGSGPADNAFSLQYMRHLLSRMLSRQDEFPGYEEVGNTAYITFDHFEGVPRDVDYYETAPTADTTDTVGLMIYAYQQVMRENSPIENVVIDLSCNTGGDADAAVFVVSAFLGDGCISAFDPMTGALTTAVYNVDINLDGKFDDGDTGFMRKNLFCLTSPVSFSCGNLVPCVFKNSNMVTLIGRTSGGGSCVVLPMSTACGTGFQMSGFTRLAFMKNGSFYDIDQGATPDYSMTNPMSYYDREGLTEYINTLK